MTIRRSSLFYFGRLSSEKRLVSLIGLLSYEFVARITSDAMYNMFPNSMVYWTLFICPSLPQIISKKKLVNKLNTVLFTLGQQSNLISTSSKNPGLLNMMLVHFARYFIQGFTLIPHYILLYSSGFQRVLPRDFDLHWIYFD